MPERVEHEIKLRMEGPAPARQALARLGATLLRERYFEDNVLLDDARRSLGSQGKILRLRRTPQGVFLTLKGPRLDVEEVKTREEIEVSVSDADSLQQILRALGLRPVFRYQKYRETYAWEGVEIEVDETPVGTFLELEGPIAGIRATASTLGFESADFITDSYAGLFFASGGTGDMVF